MSDLKTVRVGDRTDHGGTVLTGDPKRIVEGQKIARIGDMVSCPKHGNNPIVSQTAVRDESSGKQVARVSCRTQCGSIVITGANKGRIQQ